MATELTEPGQVLRVKSASPLVLASASPRRSEIMRMLGFEFEIVPAEVDEDPVQGIEPRRFALTLAAQKAEAVSRLRPGCCVIAADTVVEFEGEPVGKPAGPGEATAMLKMLSGKMHSVHTGVAVISDGLMASGVETTKVKMRELSTPEISSYVDSGAAMDKAGAYGIQDVALSPIEWRRGSYLNVVGLPSGLVARLLLERDEIDNETSVRVSAKDSL